MKPSMTQYGSIFALANSLTLPAFEPLTEVIVPIFLKSIHLKWAPTDWPCSQRFVDNRKTCLVKPDEYSIVVSGRDRRWFSEMYWYQTLFIWVQYDLHCKFSRDNVWIGFSLGGCRLSCPGVTKFDSLGSAPLINEHDWNASLSKSCRNPTDKRTATKR